MNDNIIENLSIDCVIFGFTTELKVLLVKHANGIRKDQWALPGDFIKYDESLNQAANRILKLSTGIDNLFLDQLKAFDDINRFPERRVVTIGFYALVRDEDYDLVAGYIASEAKWFSISEVTNLIYDHNQILDHALTTLKNRVRQEPIGFNLLPEKFTLGQLQNLYEGILQIKLDKPNFRRKILGMKLLIDCNEKQQGVSHRAAKLYRFDESIYQSLKEKKFILDL